MDRMRSISDLSFHPSSTARPASALLVRMRCAVGAVLLLASGAALAHGPAHGSAQGSAKLAPEQKAWGMAGETRQVSRTIDIRMDDQMRFSPQRIEVRQGETVRLRVRNSGALMHELVIGTPQELAEHAELMKKFPNMAHEEPYMTHVEPGQRGEIIWTFNRAGAFEFACLIAGHFEAGMRGQVTVSARP